MLSKLTAAMVAGSLLAVSTGAIAAAPTTTAPTARQAANAASANPWVTLSAMTSSSSAAATAAQGRENARPGFPPLPALFVILGTFALGIYILTRDDDDDGGLGLPVSPN